MFDLSFKTNTYHCDQSIFQQAKPKARLQSLIGRFSIVAMICCFIGGLLATSAQARSRDVLPSDPATCDVALKTAETEAKLPPLLLRTIGLVESGHVGPSGKVTPWAWTIDASGESHTYASKAEAVVAVKGFIAAGVKSIDVGCMQINLQSHADAFSSLDEAFDPSANTRYAAHFLKALYRRTNSWPTAAMAYHSQTPDVGRSYEAKVMALWPLAANYQTASTKIEFPNATIETADSEEPTDPNITPVFAAWLKQNADDVARNAASHQLIRD